MGIEYQYEEGNVRLLRELKLGRGRNNRIICIPGIDRGYLFDEWVNAWVLSYLVQNPFLEYWFDSPEDVTDKAFEETAKKLKDHIQHTDAVPIIYLRKDIDDNHYFLAGACVGFGEERSITERSAIAAEADRVFSKRKHVIVSRFAVNPLKRSERCVGPDSDTLSTEVLRDLTLRVTEQWGEELPDAVYFFTVNKYMHSIGRRVEHFIYKGKREYEVGKFSDAYVSFPRLRERIRNLIMDDEKDYEKVKEKIDYLQRFVHEEGTTVNQLRNDYIDFKKDHTANDFSDAAFYKSVCDVYKDILEPFDLLRISDSDKAITCDKGELGGPEEIYQKALGVKGDSSGIKSGEYA